MKLAPMRYKTYIWPHNPRVYSMQYERGVKTYTIPGVGVRAMEQGISGRALKGEGEFFGSGAYEEFRKLAAIFYQKGPGLLVHPIWQATNAYFTGLRLEQDPRPNVVRYTFTFLETFSGEEFRLHEMQGSGDQGGVSPGAPVVKQQAYYHAVARGETLWGIANRYELGFSVLMGLNPQIKNPNLIYPGEKVRVR